MKILIPFLLTLFIIKLLKPVSIRIGLLDKPNERKQHQGIVPLIGGVGLYCSFVISGYFLSSQNTDFYSWLIGGGILVAIGAIDDKCDLPVRIRVFAAISAALFMMLGADKMIYSLGNILGFGEVAMPVWVAMPFTIVAVFGVINALNMCDGIDGMAASLVIISLLSLRLLIEENTVSIVPIYSLCAALAAFLVYNLQLSQRVKKIFLGDAGSMLLGYTMVWLLVSYSQDGDSSARQFTPVTALFIIGLPLIDMVTTVVRRVNNGTNPFRPDRSHVHYILLQAGFTPRQALVVIITIGSLISSTGIVLHYLNTPEVIQFLIYFVVFGVYYKSVKHGFKLNDLLQKLCGEQTAG